MGVFQRLRRAARATVLPAAVAAIGFLSLGGDTWIIQRLAQQVARGDARRIERRLLVAQTLGPHGVPLLVAGLTSDDDQVVRSSQRGLQELLLAWRQLPPREAGQGVVVMSRELLRQAPCFSPAGRSAAEQVVRELIDWPMAPALAGRDEVLANCEQALELLPLSPALDASTAQLVTFEQAAEDSGGPVADVPEVGSPTSPQSDFAWFPDWLRLPGGGVPWRAENALPLPPWQPEFPDPDVVADPRKPRPITPPPQRPPKLFRPAEARPLK